MIGGFGHVCVFVWIKEYRFSPSHPMTMKQSLYKNDEKHLSGDTIHTTKMTKLHDHFPGINYSLGLKKRRQKQIQTEFNNFLKMLNIIICALSPRKGYKVVRLKAKKIEKIVLFQYKVLLWKTMDPSTGRPMLCMVPVLKTGFIQLVQ